MKQFFTQGGYQKISTANLVDTSAPTFAGITSVNLGTDGGLEAVWALGTSSKQPLRYQVYLGLGTLTAAALFSGETYKVGIFPKDATKGIIYKLHDGTTYLLKDYVYTMGVRSFDAFGYADSNMAIQVVTALSSGNIIYIVQQSAQKIQNASNLLMGTVL